MIKKNSMVEEMKINGEEFKEKIAKRVLGISVVGLGYVGLNIGCLFAKNEFTVYGFDISEERIEKLKNNINPIPEEDWLNPYISKLHVSTDVESGAIHGDIIFIAVPTPFQNNETDLSYLVSALTSVSKNLCGGKILVIESTVPPGTTEGLVKNVVEEITGLRAGEDFGLAFCPERVDPGNKRNFIWNTPKIVGGIDSLSTEIVSFAYSQVIDKVIPVSTPRTAEFVKVIENTQRNINIGLTNLFARTADRLKIDVEEALNAASTKWNFIRLKPGCGIGGECIGDAANMLAEVIDKAGLDSALIRESTRINESMTVFTINKVMETSKEMNKNLRDFRIGILGLAYKGNSSDTRNSPSLKIIKGLKEIGCKHIFAYDPFVDEKVNVGVQRVKRVEEALRDVDCVVIATDHGELRDIDVSILKENHIKAIIDGRNCLDKKKVEFSGIIYRGIGR